MNDLITTSRVTQNATLLALNNTNPSYLASLISAASDAIRRECGRDFVQSDYSEYYNGQNAPGEPIRLRQFPVIAISRVAASPTRALQVMNNDAATNQRATVQTTATGLTLYRVASGLPTTTTLDYSTYPTLAQLAAAINAAGGGWSALVQSQVLTGSFASWASADVRPLQGAASALGFGVFLELYTETLAFAGGDNCVNTGGSGGAGGWRLDADTGELFGHFPRGPQSLRIDYTAGFASVPDSVQEACVQLTADLYQASLVNSSVQKTTLGPASVELRDTTAATQMNGKVRMLISPYIDYAKIFSR